MLSILLASSTCDSVPPASAHSMLLPRSVRAIVRRSSAACALSTPRVAAAGGRPQRTRRSNDSAYIWQLPSGGTGHSRRPVTSSSWA